MARARPKYPQELNVLILAEANSGTGPTAILRMIQAGELEGLEKPLKMPDATFWARWAKLKRQVEPASRVPAGEELPRLDNLEREVISMLDREIGRLRKEQRKGRLTPGDIGTLRQCGKTVAELKRALKPTKGKGGQGAGTEAGRDAPSSPLQERAARFMQQEQDAPIDRNEQEPASSPNRNEAGLGDGVALRDDAKESTGERDPSHAQTGDVPALA